MKLPNYWQISFPFSPSKVKSPFHFQWKYRWMLVHHRLFSRLKLYLHSCSPLTGSRTSANSIPHECLFWMFLFLLNFAWYRKPYHIICLSACNNFLSMCSNMVHFLATNQGLVLLSLPEEKKKNPNFKLHWRFSMHVNWQSGDGSLKYILLLKMTSLPLDGTLPLFFFLTLESPCFSVTR